MSKKCPSKKVFFVKSKKEGQRREDDDTCVQQKKPAAKTKSSSDPFQLLSEDIHGHILSFLMCLSPTMDEVKKALTAFEWYSKEEYEETRQLFPHLGQQQAIEYLQFQFQALSDTSKWNRLERQDKERFDKEMVFLTTREDLLQVCTNVSVVSKHWCNVAGDIMNSQAPNGIITHRQLHELKCRAKTLSLALVCNVFSQNVVQEWGETIITNQQGEPFHILHLVIHHFQEHYGESLEGFAKFIAAEYVRFLIVKCVETIAIHNNISLQEAPTLSVWRNRCQSSLIVDSFWIAHMQYPEKYAEDCLLLFGDLLHTNDLFLDRDAGYVRDVSAESDYESKRDILFQFEKQLPRADCFFGRYENEESSSDIENTLFFSTQAQLDNIAAAILETGNKET